MNFLENLPRVIAAFDESGMRYALIGGLAMALHGVQRATFDADFILLSENLESCDLILKGMGYEREYYSENVSHYRSDDPSLGRLDFLHAFRSATLGMLDRAELIPFTENCSIPVVHTEDLIGLKIQASVNDPDRKIGDWNDIYMLIDHYARSAQDLDWDLIGDYLEIFDLEHQLKELKERYGKIASS